MPSFPVLFGFKHVLVSLISVWVVVLLWTLPESYNIGGSVQGVGLRAV